MESNELQIFHQAFNESVGKRWTKNNNEHVLCVERSLAEVNHTKFRSLLLNHLTFH